MRSATGKWQALLAFGLMVLFTLAWAGEEAKKDDSPEAPKAGAKGDAPKAEPKAEAPKTEPKAEAPKPEPEVEGPEGQKVVAKVDGVVITRAELTQESRRLALTARGQMPNNEQILDQLIERLIWDRYFDQQKLRPTLDEVKAHLAQEDAKLKQQGSSFDAELAKRGVRIQDYIPALVRQEAMSRLVEKFRKAISEEETKAEFDTHPEWYDGSRVRLSLIFVDTRKASAEPKELDKAKEKVDKLHGDLKAGKEFERLARDYSDAASSAAGGDIGWYARKGGLDETLISAVWPLKAGDVTAPIRTALGWHILKVTDRQTAYYTFQGCKRSVACGRCGQQISPGVTEALVARRLEALLAEIKGKSKIEKML